MLPPETIVSDKNVVQEETKESKCNTTIEDVFIRKKTSNRCLKRRTHNTEQDSTSIVKAKEENTTPNEGVSGVNSKENSNTDQVDQFVCSSSDSRTNLKNSSSENMKSVEEICNSENQLIKWQNLSREHSLLFLVNFENDDTSGSETQNTTSGKDSLMSTSIDIPTKINEESKIQDIIEKKDSKLSNDVAGKISPKIETSSETEDKDFEYNDKRVLECSENRGDICVKDSNPNLSENKIKSCTKNLNSITEVFIKKDLSPRKRNEINSKTTIFLTRNQNIENMFKPRSSENMANTVSSEMIGTTPKQIENQPRITRWRISKLRKHLEKMKVLNHKVDIPLENPEMKRSQAESLVNKVNEKNKKCIYIPIQCDSEVLVPNSDKTGENIKPKLEEIQLKTVGNQDTSNQKGRIRTDSTKGKRSEVKNSSDTEKAKTKISKTKATKSSETKNQLQNTPPSSRALKHSTSEKVTIKIQLQNTPTSSKTLKHSTSEKATMKQDTTKKNSDNDRCANVISSQSHVIISKKKSREKSDSKMNDSKRKTKPISKGTPKSTHNFSEHVSRKTPISLQPTTHSVSYFRTKSKSPAKIQSSQNSHPKHVSGNEAIQKTSPSYKEEATVTSKDPNATHDIVIQPKVQTTPSKLRLREKSKREAEKLSIARRHIINENWTTDVKSEGNNCSIQRSVETNENAKTCISNVSGNTKPGKGKNEVLVKTINLRNKIDTTKSKLLNAVEKKRPNISAKSREKHIKDQALGKKGEITWKTSTSNNTPGTIKATASIHRDGLKEKCNISSRSGTVTNLKRTSSNSSDVNKDRSTPRSQGSSNKSSSSQILLQGNSAYGKRKGSTEPNRPESAKKCISDMVDALKSLDNPSKPEKNYIQLNILRASEGRPKCSTTSQKQTILRNKNKKVLPKNMSLDSKDNTISTKKEINTVQNLHSKRTEDSESQTPNTFAKYPNDIIFNVPTLKRPGSPNVTYTTHRMISTVQEADKDTQKPRTPNYSRISDRPRSAKKLISETTVDAKKLGQSAGRQTSAFGSTKALGSTIDTCKSDVTRSQKGTTTKEDRNANSGVRNEINSIANDIPKTNEQTLPRSSRLGTSRPRPQEKTADGNSKPIENVAKRGISASKNEYIRPSSRKSSDKVTLQRNHSDKNKEIIKSTDSSRSKLVTSNLNIREPSIEGTTTDNTICNTRKMEVASAKNRDSFSGSSSVKRKAENTFAQKEVGLSGDSHSPQTDRELKKNISHRSPTPNRKVISKLEKTTFHSPGTKNPEPAEKYSTIKSAISSRKIDASRTCDNKNNSTIVKNTTPEVHETNGLVKGTNDHVQESNFQLKRIKSYSAKARGLSVSQVDESEKCVRPPPKRSISVKLDLTAFRGSEKTVRTQPSIPAVSKAEDRSTIENTSSTRNESAKVASAKKPTSSSTKVEANIPKAVAKNGINIVKSTVPRPKTLNVLSKSAHISRANVRASSNYSKKKTEEPHTLSNSEVIATDKHEIAKTDQNERNKDTKKNTAITATLNHITSLQDSKGNKTTRKFARNGMEEALRKKTNTDRSDPIYSRKNNSLFRTGVDTPGRKESSTSKLQINQHSIKPRNVRSCSNKLKGSGTQTRVSKNYPTTTSNTEEKGKNITNESPQKVQETPNIDVGENAKCDNSLDFNINNQSGAGNVTDVDVLCPTTKVSSIHIIDATDLNDVSTQANLLCLNIREVNSDTDLSKASEMLHSPRSHSLLLSAPDEEFEASLSDKGANESAALRSEKVEETVVIGDIAQGIAVIIRPKPKLSSDTESTDITTNDNLTYDTARTSLPSPFENVGTSHEKADAKRNNIKLGNAKGRKLRDCAHERISKTYHFNRIRSKSLVNAAMKVRNAALLATKSLNMDALPTSIKTALDPQNNLGIRFNTVYERFLFNTPGINYCTDFEVEDRKKSCENEINFENTNLTENHFAGNDEISDVTGVNKKVARHVPLVHAITILTREKDNSPQVSEEKTNVLHISDSDESIQFSETNEDEQAFLTASDSESVRFSLKK